MKQRMWVWTPKGILRLILLLSLGVGTFIAFENDMKVLGNIVAIAFVLLLVYGYFRTYKNIKQHNKQVKGDEI